MLIIGLTDTPPVARADGSWPYLASLMALPDRDAEIAGPTIRQTIGLSFLHRRERDPNLLALATVCRLTVNGPNAR